MTKSIPLRADLHYLLPPCNAWWRWSADGRWVEWADGRTIAARDELRAVLERLAPRGLPPLGAVLLLLAATRKGWSAESTTSLIVTCALTLDVFEVGGVTTGTLLDGVVARRVRADAAEIVGDLAAIAALPPSLREPIAAKTALADYLFLDASFTIASSTADGVLTLLAEGVDAGTLGARVNGDALTRIDAEFSALRPGLGRVQTGTLETWVKTGLDALVKPAEIDVPQAAQVRALLTELRDDVALGALARIAAQLLAVAHVPRNLRSHDELPLGGVSDIANRGSFDRLLVSELAHDSLTLAVRVAMNEALYLRREAPARHPPVTRTVLIDGGIRMWGVPRLYACAVALALAASSGPNDPCQVFRTAGKATARVDFATRAGLEEHLTQLSPWPDPADALIAYATAAEVAGAIAAEIFVVVERATFMDDAFWRRIAPLVDRFTLYVASVAADGAFELVQPSRIGRRQVAAVRLDLAELLSDHSSNAAKQIVARDPSLPIILQLPRFPLRLPARVKPRYAAVTRSNTLVGVTGDHRLMEWTSEQAGARTLLDSLPAGEMRGVFADADADVAYVCTTQRRLSRLTLSTVDLATGGRSMNEYAADSPLAIVPHRGVFLLIARRSFAVLHPGSGELSQRPLPAGSIWKSGRFYDNPYNGDLIAAAESGAVRVRTSFQGLFAFDRPGRGPWMMRRDWTFSAADSAETLQPRYDKAIEFGCSPTELFVSADGDRVALLRGAFGKGVKAIVVDLATGKASALGDEGDAFSFLLGPPVHCSSRAGIDVLNHFASIAVSDDGRLVISSGRARPRHLILGLNAAGTLRGELIHKNIRLRANRLFAQRRRAFGGAYRLREAGWPDGSRAWLDTRGMVHLKSGRTSLPEITCVLSSNGSVGGWTSDGQTFGWRFFLDGEPTLADAHAAALLRSFAEGLT